MLRITVEEIPGGIGPAKTLAVLAVANVSELAETSSYVYVVRDSSRQVTCGIVRGHRRSAGFWRLLARVARSAARSASTSEVPRKWRGVVDALGQRLE